MNCEYLDFTKQIDYDKLHDASQSLINGNLVIFPTDTVYGIGCNPFIDNSITKLFNSKNRPITKPINVLISNMDMLKCLTDNITDAEYKLMKEFWPGPLTIILKKNQSISDKLTSGLDTIGVRMPGNKIALDLIETANIPIATSSANISNYFAPTYLSEIPENFKDKASFIIDGGPSNLSIASTIVKIENNKVNILRQGTITEAEIKNVLERN